MTAPKPLRTNDLRVSRQKLVKLASEQADAQAANLYWLAFLITGQRGASLEMTVNALESPDGNAFFSAWMLAWARKVVIAKSLADIRQELTASARRVASKRRHCAPPRNWALRADATKAQLERALLAIDVFPRCALLLLVFEGLSIDDAMVLLDGDNELVRSAQVCAIEKLTRNLASIQGQASVAARVESAF